MSFISPIPLCFGHQPISHCSRSHHASTPWSCRPRSLFTPDAVISASHMSTSLETTGAISNRPITAKDEEEEEEEVVEEAALLPTQLSLRGLLQSENVQAIQDNLVALSRFANHLPLDFNMCTSNVDNDELMMMGKLVRDIGSSLDQIRSLHNEDTEELPYVADKYEPVRPFPYAARRRQREKMKVKLALKCHVCHRLETPKWRSGPDGPKTLCNVCGLIYTKRMQRLAEQATRASQMLTCS